MDHSKYVELRQRVRDRGARDANNREFTRRFIYALEIFMDEQTGLEKRVIRSGNQSPVSGFEAGSLNGYGSTTTFALQVVFHDHSGKQLFEHVVPFKAAYDGTTLTIRCEVTGEKVSLTTAECHTDQGKQMVANMLDEPIEKAIDDLIRKLNDAEFEV